jgi:hypothetical protein
MNEQRTVILIIDEIYVAERVEYISWACWRQLLKNVPLKVLTASVDNASTNRKCFTDFLCQGQPRTHVIDSTTGQPLFLIINPVHTLKNIYNNLQSRKRFVCPSMDTGLPKGCTVDFTHIVDLYNFEECLSLKKAHALRAAGLQSKSIEKTSVELAISVFCDSTADALNFYADYAGKTSCRGTANPSDRKIVDRFERQILHKGKAQKKLHNGSDQQFLGVANSISQRLCQLC